MNYSPPPGPEGEEYLLRNSAPKVWATSAMDTLPVLSPRTKLQWGDTCLCTSMALCPLRNFVMRTSTLQKAHSTFTSLGFQFSALLGRKNPAFAMGMM